MGQEGGGGEPGISIERNYSVIAFDVASCVMPFCQTKPPPLHYGLLLQSTRQQMSSDINPIHLRHELDILLERFRSETLITEAPELIADIREQLKSEFVEIISQYPHSTLQKAVLLTYDESLRLPIHLACDKNAPIEILRCFLDADREKISIRKKDKWGDLPLHTACSRHQTEGKSRVCYFDTIMQCVSGAYWILIISYVMLEISC